MLDRLVRWTVFAVAHGVMGEYEDGGQFHQRRESNGGPRIVAEDEESGAEGAQLGQCKPIDGGGHGVLADAEMQVLAAAIAGLEVARAFER